MNLDRLDSLQIDLNRPPANKAKFSDDALIGNGHLRCVIPGDSNAPEQYSDSLGG
jgi:hypothetical protein